MVRRRTWRRGAVLGDNSCVLVSSASISNYVFKFIGLCYALGGAIAAIAIVAADIQKISELKTARALTAGALDCYCMGMVSIQSKGPTW